MQGYDVVMIELPRLAMVHPRYPLTKLSRNTNHLQVNKALYIVQLRCTI